MYIYILASGSKRTVLKLKAVPNCTKFGGVAQHLTGN